MRYAIVEEDGTISNVINWTGDNDWQPPEDTIAVECGDSICEIGGKYLNGEFLPPPVLEPTHEEYVAIADSNKSNLMAEANLIITPLQDAVDLEMATDEEKTELIAWKKYRVLLNRIDTSLAPNIDWPVRPY